MLAYRKEQAQIREQLELTKAERLHQAFLHSQYIKTALDETDSPAWRLALEKKRERERRKAVFYQQLLVDKTRRQQTETFSLRRTVERDLDEVEVSHWAHVTARLLAQTNPLRVHVCL
jgi:hypothetical protein